MATEIEKLLVELRADVKDYQKKVTGAMKSTDKNTKKMGKDFKKFAKTSEKASSVAQRAMGTMAGFVGGAMVVGAFNRAFGAAKRFFNSLIVDGIAAAQAQEDAINKLNTALAASGKFTEEASNDLQKYASSLQQATKFGDEMILETAALIQSLGGLEKDALKGATAATMDMASALGIDLKAAAVLVGKAATGEISSFTRYGVMIEKGTTKAETFANTLDALNTKFGGAAAAQVKTFSGAVQQLSNTWGDMTEEIGFAFTENQAVVEIIKELNAIVNDLTGGLANNSSAMQELVGKGVIALVNNLSKLVVGFDTVMRSAGAFSDLIEKTFADVGMAATKVLGLFTDDFDDAFEAFSMQSEAAANKFKERFTEDTMLGDVATSLLQVGEAAERGMGKMKSGAESAGSAVKNATIETQGLTEAQKALAEEMQKRAEDGKLIAEAAILSIEEENEVKLALLAERLEGEKALMDQAREAGLISEAEHKAAMGKLDADFLKEKDKNRVKDAKREEELRKQTLNASQQLSGALISLGRGKSRELFNIGKMGSIATATMNTYEGATKALAQGGIAGPAMAAAVIATGLAQVASIQAQQFKHGTPSVPGFGRGDRMPAFLEPRERVVNRNTNDDLTQYLNVQKAMMGGFSNPSGGGTSGGGSMSIELSLKDELIEFIEAKIVERQATGQSLIGAS